jgi:anti-sigma factor RsiW
MNHEEALQLIGPYRDGELDLATCLKLEEHLAGCTTCQQKLASEQEMVGLIQTETPRFQPSPFLKTRIRATLRETAQPKRKWTYPIPLAFYELGVLGSMAVLALLASVSIPVVLWLLASSNSSNLAQEAIADHIRSLQVSHLVDVASTDQHTVKPWFAGKLDYSPQVVDLTPSGYPLIGGRLDVLDHRNVAAIIYQRRKHYINLFIWPSDNKSLHENLYNENGYHVLGWKKSGMNYLAVSELGEKELKDFVEMIQDQTIDSRPGE